MASKKSTTRDDDRHSKGAAEAAGERIALREALRGYFDKTWDELPAELQRLARADLWPWWERLDQTRRIQLAGEADSRSDPDSADSRQASLHEAIFNARSHVRDLERGLEEERPIRDEQIFREVTALLDAGERSVYKVVAAKYGISEGRTRNIVGRRRAELGLQRPRRKRK